MTPGHIHSQELWGSQVTAPQSPPPPLVSLTQRHIVTPHHLSSICACMWVGGPLLDPRTDPLALPSLCNLYLLLLPIKLFSLLCLCSCCSQNPECLAWLSIDPAFGDIEVFFSSHPSLLHTPSLPHSLRVASSHTLPGTKSHASLGVHQLPEPPMTQTGAPLAKAIPWVCPTQPLQCCPTWGSLDNI